MNRISQIQRVQRFAKTYQLHQSSLVPLRASLRALSTREGQIDAKLSAVKAVKSLEKHDSAGPLPKEIIAPKTKIPTMTRKEFFAFTKANLALLNAITAYAGFVGLAGNPCVFEAMEFLVATQLIAMSSQSYNQVMERDVDAKMKRTKNRVMVKNVLTPNQGRAISLALAAASNAMFYAHFSLQSALIADVIWLTYCFMYTPLKRRSYLNTHVGSVVGSLTPFLGSAAAKGLILAPEPTILAAYVFAWQFQHFYGICWTYKKDYDAAGFKMITEFDKTAKRTTGEVFLSIMMQMGSVVAMYKYDMINAITFGALAVPFAFSFKHLYEFSKNPTKSRMVKKSAYTQFLMILLGIIVHKYGSNRADRLYEKLSGSGNQDLEGSKEKASDETLEGSMSNSSVTIA